MALSFIKAPATGELIHAFNSNIVKVASTNFTNAFKCELMYNGEVLADVTPFNQEFTFNLVSILPTLFTSDLNDTIEPDINTTIESYVYDGSDVFILATLEFKVSYTDGSSEIIDLTFRVLQSSLQSEDFKRSTYQDTTQMALLHPTIQGDRRQFEMTYFYGYPFDISIYRREDLIAGGLGQMITIKNITNNLEVNVPWQGDVTRLFLSDGSTDITINDVLPITEGFNEIAIFDDFTDPEDLKVIKLQRVDNVCGHYLKWRNNHGGWAYWLFEDLSFRNEASATIGIIDTQRGGINDDDVIRVMGKSSQERISLLTAFHDNASKSRVLSLLRSPTIYYYTGIPNARGRDESQWISVNGTTRGAITRSGIDRKEMISFEIELPQLINVTL